MLYSGLVSFPILGLKKARYLFLLHLDSPANDNRDVILVHEPGVAVCPFVGWIYEPDLDRTVSLRILILPWKRLTYIIQTIQRREQLIQLQHGQIPAHADATASTEREVRHVLHAPRSGIEGLLALILSLQPAVRVEDICIVTENFLIAIRDGRVDAHFRARGDIPAIRNCEPAFRDDALEDHRDARVDTHSFAHDSIQIWQSIDIPPLGGNGELSAVELVDEFLVRTSIFGQVVHDGAHRGGGGVPAGEDVEHQPVDDLVVVDQVWVCSLELDIFV